LKIIQVFSVKLRTNSSNVLHTEVRVQTAVVGENEKKICKMLIILKPLY